MTTTSTAAPAGTGEPKPRRVAKFSELDEEKGMNRLQKSFYNRVFLPSFLAGEPADVQGQQGYAEVLIRDLVRERRSDPAGARQSLTTLVEAYPLRDLPYGAHDTLATFCFLDKDFAAGYQTLGLGVSASLHLTLAEYLSHPPLTAMQVLRWGEWGITTKGIQDLDNVVEMLQTRLDSFQATHGVSIVTDFWRRLTADRPAGEVAADLEPEVERVYTREDISWFLTQSRENGQGTEPPKPPTPWDSQEELINWPVPWLESNLHYGLFRAWLKGVARQAENDARDKAQVPRVGEQWPSEMGLLKQLRAALPEERFVHQHRPYWLAPQSIDIFLPAHGIAVEYQGQQHSKPIEFFGGPDTSRAGT